MSHQIFVRLDGVNMESALTSKIKILIDSYEVR